MSLKPGDLSQFNISDKIKDRLNARGISELYPVQYKTFDIIQSGKDVVVLARTGTGKTMAFSLPIVENLLHQMSGYSKQSKTTSAVILAPTRELAVQITTDLQSICKNDLTVLPVYGGVSLSSQIFPLKSGVDIVVGTPGRVIDLMDRNALKLGGVKYVVLDEVDRMLDMGFSKDVERILSGLYTSDNTSEGTEKPQTLLFSATMPSWVASVAKSYLSTDVEHISLVEDSENRTSQNVTHMALPCPYSERASTMADVMRVYSQRKESRCIIFCERKKDADELAVHSSMSSDCHVLHGDIPQDKREVVTQKFREGKYRTLITTNVAARGLDIPAIDLVIQCHPPKDVEDYIHRSGRTGRADRCGTSIVFYTPRERHLLTVIENEAGISFRRISPPTLQDIIESWGGGELLKSFSSVPKSTWTAFVPFAQSMVQKFASLQSSGVQCQIMDETLEETADTTKKTKKKKNKKRKSMTDDADVDPEAVLTNGAHEDGERMEQGEQTPLKRSVQREALLQLFCCALARLSGKDGAVEERSLLSSRKGYTTFRLDVTGPVYRKGLAYTILRQQLSDEVVELVSNLTFIRDKSGFVFDLPSTSVETAVSGWTDDPSRAQLSVATELPDIEDEPEGRHYQNNQNGWQNGNQRDNSGNRFASRSRSWRGRSFSRGGGQRQSFNKQWNSGGDHQKLSFNKPFTSNFAGKRGFSSSSADRGTSAKRARGNFTSNS